MKDFGVATGKNDPLLHFYETFLADYNPNEASRIKKDMPIMVALGNPPYSVSSQNKGAWIQGLIAEYKKDLREKKLNLDDDYIKFIRCAEHYIEKTTYGIVAMITNNSFLDGITHRQMRKHLLETFDTIYIYDLHGSTKKNETALDGSIDKNVFDIQQGVSISVFVKHTEGNKGLAKVFHYDSHGTREAKYAELWEKTIRNIEFTRLQYKAPYYFFVPKDFDGESTYIKGFSLGDLFIEGNSGIQTKRDNLVYRFSEEAIQKVIDDLTEMEPEHFREKYELPADGRDWSVKDARNDIIKNEGHTTTVHYKPFDYRWTYYTGKTKGFMAYPRSPLMRDAGRENISFLMVRNSRRGNVNCYFVTDKIMDKDAISPFDNVRFYPLYLYPTEGDQFTLGQQKRTPNLDAKIVEQIAKKLGILFVSDHTDKEVNEKRVFSPLNLLDYIYAVLHSQAYRETYKEFLQIEFPRIPYPKDPKTFHALAAKGAELRGLHLMESPALDKLITAYPVTGNHEVVALRWEEAEGKPGLGRVWINHTQYFDKVPLTAWEFHIGGYQPAQKWLKDRKGRKLTSDDLRHYQRIIVALTETDKAMNEIAKIDFLPNG